MLGISVELETKFLLTICPIITKLLNLHKIVSFEFFHGALFEIRNFACLHISNMLYSMAGHLDIVAQKNLTWIKSWRVFRSSQPPAISFKMRSINIRFQRFYCSRKVCSSCNLVDGLKMSNLSFGIFACTKLFQSS